MISDRVVQPRPDHATPGWIRQCLACGHPDIHAIYPSASMLDRPNWTCGACGCGRHTAIHIPFDATTCPAMSTGGWSA
ncbi:MAG: hypothetical protein AAGE98_21890 [Actinomycetota bacterium]